MEENKTPITGKEIKEQRKNNRIFGLFLIIDIIIVVLIIIEIVSLAKGG